MIERGVPLEEPTTHFRLKGWREGFTPHPLFDPKSYLEHSGIALEPGQDPLTHYLLFNSSPISTSKFFDPRWYLDGFGQIFASFATKGNNILEFGRSPRGTGAVLSVFGSFPIEPANAISSGGFGGMKFAHPGSSGAMWAPVMEKAFTFFRTGANTYASISSGTRLTPVKRPT